jgi:hypothetical protein
MIRIMPEYPDECQKRETMKRILVILISQFRTGTGLDATQSMTNPFVVIQEGSKGGVRKGETRIPAACGAERAETT